MRSFMRSLDSKDFSAMSKRLSRKYGTPLYIYDIESICARYNEIKQAFSGFKSLICYALKANSNLSIIKTLASLGSGADCVSINEVRRALLAGVPRYKIIFSGVGKEDSEIEEALKSGILFINVESQMELERIEKIAKRLDSKGFGASVDSKKSKLEIIESKLQHTQSLRGNSATFPSSLRDTHASPSHLRTPLSPPICVDSLLSPPLCGGGRGGDKGDTTKNIESTSNSKISKNLQNLDSNNPNSKAQKITESKSNHTEPKSKASNTESNRFQARISIRVNPHVNAKTHPYISTGLHENKFGLDIESAKRLYLYAHNSEYLSPVGIHYHIGSQILDSAPLLEATDKILELAKSLISANVSLKFFDIGGGFGINYGDEKSFDIANYIGQIIRKIDALDLTCITEPGRYIMGNSGAILTSVIGEKRTKNKRFVIIDCAMNDLIRPSLYHAHHNVVRVDSTKETESNAQKCDIVGAICESGDYIAKDRILPHCESGDLLLIESCGAYGYSMASNYNSRMRAAQVAIYKGKDYILQDREKFENSVQNELKNLQTFPLDSK